MMSRWIRTWNGKYLAPLLRGLQSLGVSLDALTLLGLLAELAAGALLAIGQWGWAPAALLLGQVLDSLDGELARVQQNATAFGGFLDSICDHYGDLAVYLGLLWYLLRAEQPLGVVLVALALFGSVFGSHVRSRAGMAGIDTKDVGLFTRFERTAVLLLGILLNQIIIALAVLAIFANFSALQRIWRVVREHGLPRRKAA
ncbi:MAG: CDP-alcohol phosphatidyltransferase family protein [Anaerolineae bacterium]